MEHQHAPPSTTTFKLIERHLKRNIEKAFNDEGLGLEDAETRKWREERDDPFVFAVKRKVIRKVIKSLEETHSWLREEYKRYLIPDKEIFSNKKWIWNDKHIVRNLRRKRNSKLIPLMNYLCNHKLGLKESESRAYDIGDSTFLTKTKKGQDAEYIFVLVRPDYDDIEKKLKMSRSLIQKYLKEMSKWGFIKPMKKLGSNEQRVYALGYYLVFPDKDGVKKPKANWFLKGSKEMKWALMDFNRPE
jgi:predicted transcriptional regulator